MDDQYASAHAVGVKGLQQAKIGLQAWQASLSLSFGKRGERTFLARRAHQGPLVIQKTLHPEGPAICHGIIVHPPGGVAGGDQLQLDVTLAEQAHTLLTTPGAGKWYKAAGTAASQRVAFSLSTDAVLEWLPQENILFDGAQADWSTTIDLQGEAIFSGWEITCFGRIARGERWQEGALRQRLQIMRNGNLIWWDRGRMVPQSRVMQSIAGLRGAVVSGSFVVAAGPVPMDILAECRSVIARDAAAGITALPGVLAIRYIGQSAEQARHYFEALWKILRPWYAGLNAERPRIWNT